VLGGKMTYILSEKTLLMAKLVIARHQQGFGSILFLEGPPGTGKTAFAKYIAEQLKGAFFYYSGSPDKERNLLYEIDVSGVLKKENAWLPGPAWEAFEASKKGPAVLLVDEVDKTNAGFDSFLLRLLEDWAFRSPNGDTIQGVSKNLVVTLTSNGKRRLRPEVLRRCQRLYLGLPSKEDHLRIVEAILRKKVRPNLHDLVFRIALAIREENSENAASPKEIAYCIRDLELLKSIGIYDKDAYAEIVASYLTKEVKDAMISVTKAVPYNWRRAVFTEVLREN